MSRLISRHTAIWRSPGWIHLRRKRGRLSGLQLLVFVFTSLVLGHHARAQIITFASVGGWEAWGGKTDNGKLVCGVSTAGNGKFFSLKYFYGNSGFTIHIFNKSWLVDDNARVKVMMQFDNISPWIATATGFQPQKGQAALEMTIPRSKLEQWIGEFRGAYLLRIEFLDNDVDGWLVDLTGTNQIAEHLATCMRAMQ